MSSPWLARLRFGTAICLCLTLAGCSPSIDGGPKRVTTASAVSAYFQSGFDTTTFDAYRASSGTRKSELRNSVVLSLMGAMDLEYTRFEQELTRERQQVPFLTGTASIALSAAGSILGDAATKATLATLDTALKGTKSTYDKEILANQTIAFLQTQMRTNRNEIRSRIISQLSQPADVYPLELALIDLEDYYAAGTVTGGLIGINNQTASELAASEVSRITSISSFGPSNATETIRQALTSGGPNAVTRLQAWMQARGINVPITIFLNSSDFTAQRAAYAATL